MEFEALREAFEERAAILEFCANMPRAEAEKRARIELRYFEGEPSPEQATLPGLEIRERHNYG